MTRAPIFGATKHFHATIPFLALLAGYAVYALSLALAGVSRDERAVVPGGDRRRAGLFAAALAVVACAPAVAETWRSHPYALTHYNLLAGGPAGGADLGLNRQFWGYATRGVLPWIDQHANPRAPVYWHDTNQAQLNMHVREQRLRADIGNTGLEENGVKASDIALVIHEKHFNKYEYWIWDFYGSDSPVAGPRRRRGTARDRVRTPTQMKSLSRNAKLAWRDLCGLPRGLRRRVGKPPSAASRAIFTSRIRRRCSCSGRLDLGHTPPNSNDWAEVEYLHLKDGRTVAGTFVRSQPNRFRALDGTLESIAPQAIANRWKKYYVSFPPFPVADLHAVRRHLGPERQRRAAHASSWPRWRRRCSFSSCASCPRAATPPAAKRTTSG